MADFNLYYPKLLAHEGGYASASYAAKIGDKGGETYLGIARNYNPKWIGWKYVDEYKAKNGEPKWNSKIPDKRIDEAAKALSKSDYWDKLRLDEVNNQSIAEYMMDFGYNSGLATPVKAVQKILGLVVDGGMGPITIGKINSADQADLFKKLQDYRVDFVSKIKTLKPDVIQGLIKRAKSFKFDGKTVAVAAVGVGFFFWILAGLVVLVVIYKQNKK